MLSSANYLILFCCACAALVLDSLFGEPKRFHPLVGFGLVANRAEQALNSKQTWQSKHQRIIGVLGVIIVVAPFVMIAFGLSQYAVIGPILDVLLLYFALGHKSLHEHALRVHAALCKQDIAAAKTAASYMVSRDPDAIEPVTATMESVLENGNDGVFGALFWYFLVGGYGTLAFRLINTLDAMWGYKTQRYQYFGWAAAKLDDVMNYVPARLTAFIYALLGHTRTAFDCWRKQAHLWDSPNAGPVMASGAGAMQVQLGGAACYQGEWHQRPVLGQGRKPSTEDIKRALQLVREGVLAWLVAAGIVLLFCEFINA